MPETRKTRKDGNRREITALAQKNASRAMERLVDMMESDNPPDVLNACKQILDRAVGTPVAMTADVTNRLDEFEDDDLAIAIADLRLRISLARRDATDLEFTVGPEAAGELPAISKAN